MAGRSDEATGLIGVNLTCWRDDGGIAEMGAFVG
jgi:hypothetical protein